MSHDSTRSDARWWTPIVYECLRGLASRALARERPGHTLQSTALVHEAFLKLLGRNEAAWVARGDFLALAARTLREVLVDHARRRGAAKRGGDRVRLEFVAADGARETSTADLLALDEALDRLGREHERAARVVELKWFGGLSVDETAAVLRVSPRTVDLDWRFARAWLGRELGAEGVR